MTLKPIWYTWHTRRRMKQRGFTREDVQALLAKGERTKGVADTLEARGYLGRSEAAVIYKENRERILIITWNG